MTVGVDPAEPGADRTAWWCPLCGFVSHNPNDARERYCVRCHVFADDVLRAPMTVEEMAGHLDVHVDRVRAALAALERRGLIRREP